jgi:hypothetical protein
MCAAYVWCGAGARERGKYKHQEEELILAGAVFWFGFEW